MSERSIEAGYEAVSKIKEAQVKLTDLIEQAAKLSDGVVTLQEVNEGLSASHTNFEATSASVKEAVDGLKDILNELPNVIEVKVSERVQAELAASEVRLIEKTRNELQDTRSTIRETLNNNMSKIDGILSELGSDLKASNDKTIEVEAKLNGMEESAKWLYQIMMALLLLTFGASAVLVAEQFHVLPEFLQQMR